MKMQRVWAMPSAWTFTIKPIKELLAEEISDGLWCDPFAGENSPAQVTNDINPERPAEHHMDAIAFLRSQPDARYDGILLDPPYSKRQISEHYQAAGVRVTGWHTSSGWMKEIKDEANRICRSGAKVICFGWNSMGMGVSRGYALARLLLVAHGGTHNDTIVTVEIKQQRLAGR